METLLLLFASCILICFLLIYLLRLKNKKQLHKIFILLLFLLVFWFVGIISQILFANRFNIPPVYFEYFVYISACFLPSCLYFMSVALVETKIRFKKRYILLFVIPCIVLLTLWTNDLHHLFFKKYSTNMNEIETGPMHTFNAIYTYILLFWSIISLLKYAIKNSGFFSKQLILIVLGSLIPIVVNILGTFGIINMTVYVTPICFGLAISLYAFAIFKFNFLEVSPIALQKIVDRISDSYIVLNDDGSITDFNQTFLTTFNIKDSKDLRGQNFETFLKGNNLYLNFKKIKNALPKVKNSEKTVSFDLYIRKIEKHFHIEINSILSEGASLGTLILFKDVTQHIEDMQKIAIKVDDP